MTLREPEWSEQDRAWLQALLALEAGRCPGCGGDLEETTESDPMQGYDVKHFPCKRCQSLDIARTAYHEKHKNKDGQSDIHNHVWTTKPIRSDKPREAGRGS